MEPKIQLLHPAGKHAVKMERAKYEVLKKAILHCLKPEALTHTQLVVAVNSYLEKNKIQCSGSMEWYLESVKLDLEARNIIWRIKEKGKLQFGL